MSKHKIWWVACVLAALLAAPWAGLLGDAGLPAAAAQGTIDDEVVYIDSAGYIKVYDPFVPSGKEAVVWQSPDSGWLAVATGDLNGDGDDEIVAIKGSTAKAFDPVVQSGQVAVAFEETASPYIWERVAVGDIDGDGLDEIVLTRSDSNGSIRERLMVYNGNASGTSWTKIRDNSYTWPWDNLALGDVNDDGREDIAMTRNYESASDRRLTILNPVDWSTLHDKSYGYAWLTMAIGQTHADTNRKEIVMTREDVQWYLDSYLVFRWKSGSSNLEDVADETFYPYFTSIALGDVNASGDLEVALVRDPESDSGISLIMRNYGTDAIPTFETAIGRQWRIVKMGDVDGDNKAELVVGSSTALRVYTEPEVSKSYLTFSGTFRTYTIDRAGYHTIALGNLDGEGIAAAPKLGVSPTSFSLTITGVDTETRNVTISNTGATGEVNWTASVTQGSTWLSVSPTSGTATLSSPSTVTLTINTAALTPGSYEGTVRIEAPGIEGSPQDVIVDLTVEAPPFGVSPTSLFMTVVQGQPYISPTIEITGDGIDWVAGAIPAGDWDALATAIDRFGKLERTATGWRAGEGPDAIEVEDVSWVILTPSEGTAPSTILVSIKQSQLTPGVHRATIIIDSGPSTSPRFHGVDLTVLLADHQNFVPAIVKD
ncbi:MAG: hypothetical protein Kow0047_09010 [Anaerolineae bacterium]